MSLYQNPMIATIQEASELLMRLDENANALAQIIADEKIAKASAQDARETLEAADSELIFEEEILAQAGEGRLKGIAKTSKSYQNAVDHILSIAHATSLAQLYRDANRMAIEATNMAIRLEQCQCRFSAMKHASTLMAAILEASKI